VRIGIVGMPNAGKSSLFNALTKAGAEAANYPFTTVEPNVAVVPVRDERLDQVAATLGSHPITYETIAFHDIAGLVRGAHQGEGLGNQFLSNIRETDAIVHVVRAHDDSNVVHPEGRVDPSADIDTIETELLYADLESAERRLERVSRQAKSGERAAVAENAWVAAVVEALREGRPARSVPVARRRAGRAAQPPAAHLQAGSLPGQRGRGRHRGARAVAEYADRAGARAVAVSARIEAELSELDDEESSSMREELGVPESGLDLVVREAFALLDLIQFFTAGEDRRRAPTAIEARHHRLGRGGRDPHGHPARLRARRGGAVERARGRRWLRRGARPGTLRLEGRDYKMRDGDVITVKFTP